jgi:hypothetical protein
MYLVQLTFVLLAVAKPNDRLVPVSVRLGPQGRRTATAAQPTVGVWTTAVDDQMALLQPDRTC